jgi:hypothetical protein
MGRFSHWIATLWSLPLPKHPTTPAPIGSLISFIETPLKQFPDKNKLRLITRLFPQPNVCGVGLGVPKVF